MTRAVRRRTVARAAAAMAAIVLGSSACTSATDEFCEQLADQFRLDALAEAIRSNDTPAITRELGRLRSLEASAPAEVIDDLREVVDVTGEAVRAVTAAREPGVDQTPIDLTTLNDELSKIEPAAQRVAAFADENCGLRLNGTGLAG